MKANLGKVEAKPLPAGFQGTPPVHGRRNPGRLGGSSGLQWRSGVWKAGGMLYVDSDSPIYIQHNPGSPFLMPVKIYNER